MCSVCVSARMCVCQLCACVSARVCVSIVCVGTRVFCVCASACLCVSCMLVCVSAHVCVSVCVLVHVCVNVYRYNYSMFNWKYLCGFLFNVFKPLFAQKNKSMPIITV